jgi:hypothetical protein
LNATDPDSDDIQYIINLYQTDCTTTPVTFDQSANGSGWDNGTTAYTSGTTATYTLQFALNRGGVYCWNAQAKDPGGTNSYGTISADHFFTVDDVPSTPTLTAPSSGATGVSTTPTFTFSDTDPDSDDIQFTINLFQSNCTTSVTTYAMSSGQTGWSPTFDGTAGSGLTYLSSTAGTSPYISFTPSSALSNSTTYCWSVSAIDPGGSNTTTTSSTQSFTTAAAGGTEQLNIGGGVNITGGTNVY